MVGLPDFRSHSKSGPFSTQPLFYYWKSRLVRISDPPVVNLDPYCTFNMLTSYLFVANGALFATVELLVPLNWMRCGRQPDHSDPTVKVIFLWISFWYFSGTWILELNIKSAYVIFVCCNWSIVCDCWVVCSIDQWNLLPGITSRTYNRSIKNLQPNLQQINKKFTAEPSTDQ